MSENPNLESRGQRIRELVEDYRCRREAGEAISEESLVAAHAELMPELAAALGAPRLIAAARAQVEAGRAEEQTADTPAEPRPSNGLQIRCPHCHTVVDIAVETPFADIACTACGIHFSLTRDEMETHATESVTTVGHFELIERVGLGGFGTVWKARDTELDRTVAVKIPRKGQLQPDEIEQFLREARTAAQLNHPNIVGIHEVGRDADTVYIVSDLVRGVSLSDCLTGQRLTVTEAAELCRKIAEALHHAHDMGVIHRDLKPQNVMIDTEGQPHLMDFGLARREVGEITVTVDGQLLGTPAYMSPEQAKGEAHRADRRSDIYSLGAVLFELLTGELPFRGNSRMLIHQVIHDEAPSPRKLNANVPRDLETICLKCLEKDPHKRYDSAQEVADELRRVSRGEAIEARPISSIARGWRWYRRYPAVSSLGVGLLVVLLAGLTGVTSQWIRADRERLLAGKQRDTANRHLYQALVGQARALRLARVSGFRRDVFDVLGKAMAVDTPARNVAQLRHEATACMGDFVGLEPAIWEDLPSDIRQIAARPHAAQLAIGLTDGTVLLHDIIDGKEIAHLSEHSSPIRVLEFGPDGSILASGDDDGKIQIWKADDRNRWSSTKTFLVEGSGINGIAITPDGKRLFASHDSGSRLTTYSITDESDDSTVIELAVPSTTARSLGSVFSPDATIVATGAIGDSDRDLLVWDIATQQLLASLKTGVNEAHSGAFSRNGQFLVCACEDGVVFFDRSEDWAKTVLSGDVVLSVAISSDNQLLAIAAEQLDLIRLWSVPMNREVAVLSDANTTRETHVAFSHDGKRLVVGGPRSVRVWDLTGAGEQLTPAGHTRGVPALAFHPDGTLLASASKDRTVRIWNALTGDLVRSWPKEEFARPVQAIAFSPDGRMLVTGDWAGAVQIWDVQSGQRLGKVEHQLGPLVMSVAFSPNGEYFAASGNAAAAIWRLPAETDEDMGRELPPREYTQLSLGNIISIDFSPDSRRLVWVDKHGPKTTAHVWDIAGAVEILATPLQFLESIQGIAFCPNSRLLTFVSLDRAVEVWDVPTRQRTLRYAGRDLPSTAGDELHGRIALSKDGCSLVLSVVTDLGQALTIWDTKSQELLLKLPEERGAIWAFALSPDRSLLAVGTSTGGPTIWSVPKIRSQLAQLGLDW